MSKDKASKDKNLITPEVLEHLGIGDIEPSILESIPDEFKDLVNNSYLRRISSGDFGDNRVKEDQTFFKLLDSITRISQDRLSYFKVLKEFEGHYLISAISDVVFDEVFKDTGEGVRIEVECEVEKYQDEIEDFISSHDLPLLLEDCFPHLLLFGEYSFKVESGTTEVEVLEEPKSGTFGGVTVHQSSNNPRDEIKPNYKDEKEEATSALINPESPSNGDGVGITKLVDEYYSGEVTAVYDGASPVGFFRIPAIRNLMESGTSRSGADSIRSPMSNILTNAEELGIGEVFHLSLGGSKIKINLDQESKELMNTPSLRVGRSYFWSAIDRLQILKFKEIADAAIDLSQLTRPTLVGVAIPQTESGNKALPWIQKMEKLLNSGSQDPSEKLRGVGGIASGLSKVMSSRIKVVPTFPNGKGTPEKLGIEDQIKDNGLAEKIREERDLILQILGMPPELVYNSEKRGDQSTHKLYSRLSKRIKQIQRGLGRSISQLLTHHIALKYGDLEISEHDFTVKFEFGSQMEDVDDAEALGYVLDNVKSVLQVIEDLNRSGVFGEDEDGEPKNAPVDSEEILNYIKSEMKKSGSESWKIFGDIAKPKSE